MFSTLSNQLFKSHGENQTEFIEACWFEIHLNLKDPVVSLQCGESVWLSAVKAMMGICSFQRQS